MKQIFTLATFAMLVAATSSCSLFSKYTDLDSINVGDAKMIFQMDSSTRSSGGTGFWKIDQDGNEVELQIYNKEGKSENVEINTINRIHDDLLFIYIIGVESESFHGNMIYLVNTKDERLFAIPGAENDRTGESSTDLWKSLWWMVCTGSSDHRNRVKEDSDGNIYLPCRVNGTQQNQIIKLNTTDYSMNYVLPANDEYEEFFVNAEGFVCWGSDTYDSSSQKYIYDYKIACPGGRTIPLEATQALFYLNKEFYICDFDQAAIYHCQSNGNNDMEFVRVCDYTRSNDKIHWASENKLRNCVIMGYDHIGYGSERLLCEFDGESVKEIKITEDNCPSNFGYTASNACYKIDGYTITKLDMSTYETSEITISREYALLNYYVSFNTPGVRISGYKYLDSSGIYCTIDENDNISVESVFSNINDVVSLIEIF